MADIAASVRDLVDRDCDCTEKALAQMDLRRKINLMIGEWKAAGAATFFLMSEIGCAFVPRTPSGQSPARHRAPLRILGARGGGRPGRVPDSEAARRDSRTRAPPSASCSARGSTTPRPSS